MKFTPFLIVISLIFPLTSYSDGWIVESDIVSLGDTNPGGIEMSGPTVFLRSQRVSDNESELQIFEKSPEGWNFTQLIPHPDNDPLSDFQFATHLAISGSRALVLHNSNGLFDTETQAFTFNKSIGVYERGADSWDIAGFIPLNNAVGIRAFDLDGNKAAISVIVDSGLDNENGLSLYSDAVQVWILIDGLWTNSATIENPDAGGPKPLAEIVSSVEFGFDVDMVGSTIAVSTKPFAVNAIDNSNGSVYLFELIDAASGLEPMWELQKRLTQDTSIGNVTFGQQVDLTSNRLLITATNFNTDYVPTANGAYLYKKDASGLWVDDGVIRDLDSVMGDFIGQALGADFFPFEFFGALLADEQPVVWTREFGIALELINNTWQPAQLYRRSAAINSLQSNSFSEIRYGNGSIVFNGRGAFVPDMGPPSVLIVFDTECASSRPLEPLQWTTITPPCLSPDIPLTVSDLFSDDFGDAVFSVEWSMFRFDLGIYNYEPMQLDDVVVPGEGYWIINGTDETVTIDLPGGTTPTAVNLTSNELACVDDASGCLSATLPDFPLERSGFRMIGNPLNSIVPIGDIRLSAATGSCAGVCDLDEADDGERVNNILYRYRGGPAYDFLTTSDQLLPWDAAFLATYEGAFGTDTQIVFPQIAE